MNPTNTFTVTVNGSPLPRDLEGLVVSVYVDDSLNLPDMFAVTFRDPNRIVFDPRYGIEVGAKVTISVVSDAAPGGQKLISDAEITAMEAEHDPLGTLSVIRGLDQSHRLFRGNATEAYHNMSYSDVAGKVAQRNGLSPGQIDPTTAIHDLVSQVNVSDWQFLSGLAREVGYEVLASEGKLDFRKPEAASGAPASGTLASSDPLQLVLGENLLQFRCSVTSSQQVGEVKVRSWDPMQKREIVASAPAHASGAGLAVTPSTMAAKFGTPVHISSSTPYATQPECEAAAKAMAEDIAGSFVTLDGVALGNIKLKAGCAVSLGLVGKPFDGRYKLSTTRHQYDPDEGYTTRFTVSGRQDSTLLSLASSGNGTGGFASGKTMAGVVQGIVTNVKDPQKLCRVKVKFPWLSDSYESDWVRTLQVSAGNGYGSVVLPEVGDEVLVAFEQGDLRRPYLLGGLYNGVDKPPDGSVPIVDESSGKVNRRDLVSRTGHRLSFTEKTGGSDGILLKTGDDKYVLEMSKTNTKLTINADGTIEIEAKGAPGDLKITAVGNLDLKARKITMKADTGVQVDGGGGAVDLKGVQFNAEGTAAVAVKGATISVNANATAELKAGAMITVQGALVKIN